MVASLVETHRWRFTTIHTPKTGGHPVTGHREWGYGQNESGDHVFYTRGADRSTSAAETMLDSVTFTGADWLWLSFQNRLADFVNTHGGEAIKTERFSRRFPWTPFRQLVKGLPWEI